MSGWRFDTEWLSTRNDAVKRLALLKNRSDRIGQGLLLLEGPHVIEEALAAGCTLTELLVNERGQRIVPVAQWKERFGTRLGQSVLVSDAVMDKLSDAKTPQGVLAAVKLPPAAPSDFWQKASAVIVLDGLTDPGNLGTIVRSAAAMGVDGIWLGEGCVDLFHPKTVRATQGAVFHLPFCQAPLQEAQKTAADAGAAWLALTPRGGMPLHEVDAKQKTWWVIGSEAHGVQTGLSGARSVAVSIPMNGRTESLNAAMAATIALYEMNRQRQLHT